MPFGGLLFLEPRIQHLLKRHDGKDLKIGGSPEYHINREFLATADTVPSSGPGTFREAVTSTEAADSDISKQTPANFRLPTFAVSTKSQWLIPPLNYRLTPLLNYRVTPPLNYRVTPPLNYRLTPPLNYQLTPPLNYQLTPLLNYRLT
eukprot:Em0004g1374a